MKLETRIQKLKNRFEKRFETPSTEVFLSPGRIELLGNHTDHNNGKVLVSSVDLTICAVASKRDDDCIVFSSVGFPIMKLNINRLGKKESEYGTSKALIRGVLYQMKKRGYQIGGLNVVADSNVPKGAGVSSSAAFEVLVAKMISYYYNNDKVEPFELAQISQYSESVYFNKPCGLLDQSGIALGGINYIDFKSTEKPLINNLKVTIPGYQFLLINTGDDHTKLTPYYAAIKDEMKLVANYFGKDVLREVDPSDFEAKYDELKEIYGIRPVLRAKHYFEENDRVDRAYLALLNKDYKTFLENLNESGLSSYYQLQNCYCESEDEKLARALRRVKEIDQEAYSRVHGGGFAGTLLMIVPKKNLKEDLVELYNEFGKNNVMKVSLFEYGTTLKEEM